MHSSRRSSPGSLDGSAAARNWSSRFLRSATNWPSCVASGPAVPASAPSIGSWGSRLYRVWPRCLDVIVLVKSATVVQWHRQGFRLYWRWRSRPGRRAVDHDIRRLIREMSYANPLWGAPRIHGRVAQARSQDQSGDGRQVHAAPATHAIADWAQLPQQRSTRHRRYRDLHRAICGFPTPVRDAHPSSRPPKDGPLRCHAASDRGLVVAPVTKAFPWDAAPRYLLRDRDSSYSEVFSKRVAVMDIAEVVIAPRSPWQNPYVDRAIGSIRR